MTGPIALFDRRALRLHRDRAAASVHDHDALFAETAERLADRLDDITRAFPMALDLGCHGGHLARRLGRRGGIEWLVEGDLSPAMAGWAATAGAGPAVVVDEEALPFRAGSFDAVLSCLSLHWVNDLPGALVQIRRALKPDGLFLAAMLGGATLCELRQALIEAESDEAGGASPRVSPFADLADMAALLSRAGFALPVADSDTITVTYPDALALMRELRGMGEANATVGRQRGFARRGVLLKAADLYRKRHGLADGRIPATFQILYLTGWAPHPSQPQPLPRGSASARLSDALARAPGTDRA
jgi:SAM-dependent methyltransferase